MARFGDLVRDLDLGGFFRGVVVERVDPRGEGRVGVFIPSLLTEAPAHTETPSKGQAVLAKDLFHNADDLAIPTAVKTSNYIWARPCSGLVENGRAVANAGGDYRIPQVGTVVRVWFEHKDPNRPYYDLATPTVNGDVVAATNLGKGTNVTTAAANWSDPAKKVNIRVLHEDATGNVVYIDGNKDNNALVLRWANGHTLSIGHAAESGIVLETEKGHRLQLDENSQEIRVTTHSGNAKLVLKDDGSVTVTNTGPTTVTSKGPTTVKSDAQISLTAPMIYMNS